MIQVAVFASGSGTNAWNLMSYFENHPQIRVVLVLSNKADAPVLEKAARFGVSTLVFDRKIFYETTQIPDLLLERRIEWIVLAGFLWLVPENLLATFPQKIINLHPALLPKFGGKGMYGMKVHEAVLEAGETSSGITIHFADKHYDEGSIIFQAECALSQEDTPETLAAKIHELEYRHLPEVVEKVILERSENLGLPEK